MNAETLEILRIYDSLPADEKHALNTVVVGLATLQEPKRGMLRQFMEWANNYAAEHGPHHAHDLLMLMAQAVDRNKTAWGVSDATLCE